MSNRDKISFPPEPVFARQQVSHIKIDDGEDFFYNPDTGETTTINGTKKAFLEIVPYPDRTAANPGKIVQNTASDGAPTCYMNFISKTVPTTNLNFRFKSSAYTSGNWNPSVGSIGSLVGTFTAPTVYKKAIKITSGNSIVATMSDFYAKNYVGFLVFMVRPASGTGYSGFSSNKLNIFKFFNAESGFIEPSLAAPNDNQYNLIFGPDTEHIKAKSSFWGPIALKTNNNIVNNNIYHAYNNITKPRDTSSQDLIFLVDFNHFSDTISYHKFISNINGNKGFVSKTFSKTLDSQLFSTLTRLTSDYTLKFQVDQTGGTNLDLYLYDFCFYVVDDTYAEQKKLQAFTNEVKKGLIYENKELFLQTTSTNLQISGSTNLSFDTLGTFINILGAAYS
jgi:ribosomal protein L35AE/L33A